MAYFEEASPGGAVNVSTVVGAEITNVARNGKTVTFSYRAYIYQNTEYWSKNTWALWIEGTQYNVKDYTSQSSQWAKYYTPWRDRSISLEVSVNSTTVPVGVNGLYHFPESAATTLNLNLKDLPTASAPSLSGLSISNVGDTYATTSFSIINNNNASIADEYIDLSYSEAWATVKTINTKSGTFYGLDPNRKYYARGNSSNIAGRTYTGIASFTTTYRNPGAPGQPVLTYDQQAPIPRANLKATWTVASAGSTPIAGYRIRLFKNDIQVLSVDTESTALTYTFGTFEDLGFEPGDIAKVGIYSYSKDWAGNKHFNGGGTAQSQVFSTTTITVVSDKFIYTSFEGGDFDKKKLYVSINGGDFVEVRKESFKIIT